MVLQLHGVSKVYGRRAALDGVSLKVDAGDVVAVLGPSGSGKTTLVGLAAGFDRPTSGLVAVTGQPLDHLGEAALARFRRQRIGVVFQGFHLLPRLTVLENVMLPAQLASTSRRAAAVRAHDLLDRLHLTDHAGRLPAELSGGEQQRAAIARALVNRPSLLLADEPTGALDSAGGAEVMRLLEEAAAGEERARPAVVLVTHDADLAATWAHRVVRLRDGRITDDVQLPPVIHRQPPARHLNGDWLEVRAPAVALPVTVAAPTANGAHHPEAT